MNVHKSHKEHISEHQKFKEKLELWKTKQQHFNVKNPNFLTYIEKEQIKLLHSKDPEEWDPEKLSESFPATPENISKICKAKWIALSEDRIKKHDEKVLKNWSLFKSGNLPIFDKELKEHIEKFANRSLKDIRNVPLENVRKPIALEEPAISEFSSIITSCKKYKDEPKQIEAKSDSKLSEVNNKITPGEDETFLLDKVTSKKNLRFQDLKSLVNPVRSLPVPENPSGTGVVKSESNPFSLEKFEKNEIVISKEDAEKFQITPIKDKVYIPKKLYKKGNTYRVEDCYYDSDGEFLYRVPGMTGH